MADNSKFYWIKLRTDFFAEDSKIDDLMTLGAPNGAEYVCLYLKLCLMTANKGGRLCSERGEVIIPYNAEKIARDAKYFSVDTVVVAMNLYKRLGLIYEETDGVLAITDAGSMVGSESASRPAIKMRNYRDKLKNAKVTEKVTNCNPKPVTICPTDIRDKENRDKDINIKTISAAPEAAAPAVISLPLNDKTEFLITQAKIDEWTELYPAVNVLQELRNMKGWLDGNPTRRKTKSGILRFITGWLAKEQNRGPKTAAAPKKPASGQFNYEGQRKDDLTALEKKLFIN